MWILFVVWGFVLGAAITYIIFVLKPYKKDKIKYFVVRDTLLLKLIEVNFTKKKTEELCSDMFLFLYGLDKKDYDDLPRWGHREVNIKSED